MHNEYIIYSKMAYQKLVFDTVIDKIYQTPADLFIHRPRSKAPVKLYKVANKDSEKSRIITVNQTDKKNIKSNTMYDEEYFERRKLEAKQFLSSRLFSAFLNIICFGFVFSTMKYLFQFENIMVYIPSGLFILRLFMNVIDLSNISDNFLKGTDTNIFILLAELIRGE